MIFLDTSVVIAAAQKQHRNHKECVALWHGQSVQRSMCPAFHCGDLERALRHAPTLQAASFRSAGDRATGSGPFAVSCTYRTEYMATIESLVPRGLMGGIVYDALWMRCVRKERRFTP